MTAPFRINRRYEKVSPDAEVIAASAPPGADEKTRAYFDRLVSMIPGDIVSLYLAGASFIGANLPNATTEDKWYALGWAAFCLVALIGLRVWGAAEPRKSVPLEKGTPAISVVSYLIWLYTIGCPFELIGIPVKPKLGSLLILAWTFLVPMFYSGDNFGGPGEKGAEAHDSAEPKKDDSKEPGK